MDQTYLVKIKYDLSFGRKFDGRLVMTRDAGHALNIEGTNYYNVYLWHTGKYYYLSPNRDKETTYTIFEKKTDDANTSYFRNPVGRAWVPSDLKTHLELDFNAMEKHLFMSLYPST